jgi:hypothetical protein
MEILKPIGTIYTKDFPLDLHSTNPCPHRITWKVVGHVDVEYRGLMIKAEKVEAINYEELPAPTFIPY